MIRPEFRIRGGQKGLQEYGQLQVIYNISQSQVKFLFNLLEVI